jgi:hypothetical protein
MANNNNQSTVLDLEYLNPSDQVLIQPLIPDIIADATQYLENLKSDKLKNYTKYHHLIYSKYAGRKYKIETPINQIIVHTSDGKKTLIHIHKPGYMKISTKLDQYKKEINSYRAQLDTHYLYMKLATSGITPAEKDDFIKKKKEFISLLKKYYTILAYIQLRNRNNTDQITDNNGTTLVNISRQIIQLKDISGSIVPIPLIDSKIITVPKEQVDQKQQYQSDKLNQYNEILTLLQNKSSEGLKEKIVSYLDNSADIEFKITSDVYSDLIVVDLPQIITSD